MHSAAVAARVSGGLQDRVHPRIRDLVHPNCGIYHAEEKVDLLAGARNRPMPQVKMEKIGPADGEHGSGAFHIGYGECRKADQRPGSMER
jgi:hypothetical protein